MRIASAKNDTGGWRWVGDRCLTFDDTGGGGKLRFTLRDASTPVGRPSVRRSGGAPRTLLPGISTDPVRGPVPTDCRNFCAFVASSGGKRRDVDESGYWQASHSMPSRRARRLHAWISSAVGSGCVRSGASAAALIPRWRTSLVTATVAFSMLLAETLRR